MGFWIYMLLMNLLLPFTMIGIGKYFMKKPPNAINRVFGYRTSMSMKNKEKWEFELPQNVRKAQKGLNGSKN